LTNSDTVRTKALEQGADTADPDAQRCERVFKKLVDLAGLWLIHPVQVDDRSNRSPSQT